MEIIGGLDVHRKQITFDYIELETGEVKTGHIRPATRENLRTTSSPGLRAWKKPHSRWKRPRGLSLGGRGA